MAPCKDCLGWLRPIANSLARRILSLAAVERVLLNAYVAGSLRRYPEFRLIADEATKRSESGRAIEIGMGPAPVLLHCLSGRFQGELLGTDIDPRSVMMSSRMWKSSFDHLPVEFLVCAGEFLPFRDETSDLILSVNSLHHWNHPIKIFTEVKRILKPGGGAVIVDYRRDLRKEQLRALEASYRNPILRYRLRRSIEESYLPSEVNRLLKRSGFTRREVTAVPNGLKAGGTK